MENGEGTATVDYYDVVPDTTHVLDAEGTGTLAVSNGGSHISIGTGSKVARSLHVGDVLVIGPTADAPLGMLAKVLAIRAMNGRIEAQVRRASFMEAITRGRLSGTVSYSPESLRIRNLVGHNQRPISYSEARSQGLVGGIGSMSGGCPQPVPAVEIPFSYTFGIQADGSVGTSGSAGLSLGGPPVYAPT